MSLFGKIKSEVSHFVSGVKSKVTQRRDELAHKRRVKQWGRKRARVRDSRAYCESQLDNQLLDEHLQQVMTARVRNARLPGIGSSQIESIENHGIHTAYDVYRNGEVGLCQVFSIGPKRAGTLVNWAQGHFPNSFEVDKRNPDYIRRLRIITHKHFDIPLPTTEPPPPKSDRSQQYDYSNSTQGGRPDYYAILGVPHGASCSEIKAAYRQRSHEYHPDKVAHLGPDLRSLAESKMKQINEAYEALSAE
jgi:hypothetical protein